MATTQGGNAPAADDEGIPVLEIDSSLPSAHDCFDFGPQPIGGGGREAAFTLRNVGDAGLELTGTPPIRLEGAVASYRAGAPRARTLAPGEETTFDLTFAPASGGLRPLVVHVDYAGGDLALAATCFVEGRGVGPEINVKQGEASLAHHGFTYHFGSLEAGDRSAPVPFVIESLGDEDLKLTGRPKARLTGADKDDFEVVEQPSSPVPPGETAGFAVRFTPRGTGARTAQVSLASNDRDESPYVIELVGLGQAAEGEGHD